MLQDHEIVEARFLRGWNEANSRIPALDVTGTDFSLLGDLLVRTPWDTILE